MTDIVERAREAQRRGPHIVEDHGLYGNLADEIERLTELLRAVGANRDYWEGRWREQKDEIERLRTENSRLQTLVDRWAWP